MISITSYNFFLATWVLSTLCCVATIIYAAKKGLSLWPAGKLLCSSNELIQALLVCYSESGLDNQQTALPHRKAVHFYSLQFAIYSICSLWANFLAFLIFSVWPFDHLIVSVNLDKQLLGTSCGVLLAGIISLIGFYNLQKFFYEHVTLGKFIDYRSQLKLNCCFFLIFLFLFVAPAEYYGVIVNIMRPAGYDNEILAIWSLFSIGPMLFAQTIILQYSNMYKVPFAKQFRIYVSVEKSMIKECNTVEQIKQHSNLRLLEFALAASVHKDQARLNLIRTELERRYGLI